MVDNFDFWNITVKKANLLVIQLHFINIDLVDKTDQIHLRVLTSKSRKLQNIDGENHQFGLSANSNYFEEGTSVYWHMVPLLSFET